jgi:hypothetical protein
VEFQGGGGSTFMKLVVLESVHAILNIRMLELECFYHLLRCHLVGFIFVFAWCCLDGVNTFRSFTCVHLVNYRAVHVRYNFNRFDSVALFCTH